MPANRQTVPRVEREGEILRAARDVFLTEGYDGATVGVIAALAGMTSTNVHYYFATKEALFVAVARQTYQEVLATLDALDDPVARLQGYVAFHLGHHAFRGPVQALAARSDEVAALLVERDGWLADTVALVTDDELDAAVLTATVTGLVEAATPHPKPAKVLTHAVARLVAK
jgi:AcrR family transcriptional regulator